MPLNVIIGAQWGDEGKGRIVDAVASEADAVVRFQGGPNAGHTVYIGEEKYVFHLIPMGILNEGTLCCISLGVAVDPIILLNEIIELEQRGILVKGRLLIDPRCSLITPEHIKRDKNREHSLGQRKLGTTQRGIGPAFSDRAGRVGWRLGTLIGKIESGETLGLPESYLDACIKLKSSLADVSLIIYNMLNEGKTVIAEGGQGTMLDLGLGTYPYVTSTNTVAAAAPVSLGLSPRSVDSVIGVMKAYVTRVGEGPFPTEIEGAAADKMREEGDEYGATTGRPRRCGWFDGVIAKYAARVNGIDEWALTKLDVLDHFDPIFAAVAYEIDGERADELPPNTDTIYKAKPVYHRFPGWKTSTRMARKIEDLPFGARAYLDFIQEFTGVRLGIVSVGYERKCMIRLEN